MVGISSKALNGIAENRRKYNDGSELDNKEFSDGKGLELYSTSYRGYDPQIGRFWQVDPLCELSSEFTVYNYACDNPILRNDPLGLKDSVTASGESVNTAEPLPTVEVSGKKKTSVGQPGFGESFIPMWGSGRAAVDDFQNGKWGWGIFNTAMAISDIILVKTAVTVTGKLVAKGLTQIATDIARINTERITLATLRHLNREALLASVTNPKLRRIVEALYRPGAKIGSGSTADVIRIVGDAGHIEKGGNYMTGLRNLINSGELRGTDLDTAVELLDDLTDAIGGLAK